MQRTSFNKENAIELFSQLVKILEKEGKTSEVPELIKEVKKLSVSVQEVLRKSKQVNKEAIKTLARKRLAQLRESSKL